jgi:hypothetical protein
MGSRKAFQAFLMLGILLMSSAGCIGLVPAREFVEQMRPQAELVIESEHFGETYIFPAGWSLNERISSWDIVIDSDVVEVRAYFKASFALADSLPFVPEGARYVEATLSDAEGNIVWTEKLTVTQTAFVFTELPPFEQGTWNLYLSGRGFGNPAAAGIASDSYQIMISVDRNCWNYPIEGNCDIE